MKKREKSYYSCYIRANDKLVVCTTRQYIADLLGVNDITLYRHLNKCDVWIHDQFIVWKNIRIIKAKKGFAL